MQHPLIKKMFSHFNNLSLCNIVVCFFAFSVLSELNSDADVLPAEVTSRLWFQKKGRKKHPAGTAHFPVQEGKVKRVAKRKEKRWKGKKGKTWKAAEDRRNQKRSMVGTWSEGDKGVTIKLQTLIRGLSMFYDSITGRQPDTFVSVGVLIRPHKKRMKVCSFG